MSTEHDAIRYGDEYQCAKCGKAWGVNDADPPPCDSGLTTYFTQQHRIAELETEVSRLKHELSIQATDNATDAMKRRALSLIRGAKSRPHRRKVRAECKRIGAIVGVKASTIQTWWYTKVRV